MEKDIISDIKEYWVLLVFVGGVIATWVLNKKAISDHEKRIGKIEEQILTLDKKIDERMDLAEKTSNEIKVRLAEIQTTLKYIEQKINK